MIAETANVTTANNVVKRRMLGLLNRSHTCESGHEIFEAQVATALQKRTENGRFRLVRVSSWVPNRSRKAPVLSSADSGLSRRNDPRNHTIEHKIEVFFVTFRVISWIVLNSHSGFAKQ